ncbi:MAG TPA: amidohydrolase [Bacteroidetes bacterium]|nr:amidohydrolase [Bacteroidota bacterium]
MLIDSHTHIGTILYPVGKNRVSDLPGEDLLAALQKYSIDFALVSSIESAEFDSEGQLAPPEKQIPQLESFRRLVQFVQTDGGISLKALLWIKPYTEKVTPELEQFITENREYIAGLKMHPSLSNIKFIDDRFCTCLEMASKFKLPVQVHTENDGLADPVYIAEMAVRFPGISFIMVHMGLNTDNDEAINIIKDTDNIYGDTCEVKSEKVIEAIIKCGSEKILFGTDAVVNGIDTYAKYMPLVDLIRNTFSKEEAENVVFRNCMRIYKVMV